MTAVPRDVIRAADTGSFMTVSSQCLTLGSRNFIKLVSIKVAVLC
ncbi:MAG: hypothetical protein ACR5LA_13085 [Wolbachia sp.]